MLGVLLGIPIGIICSLISWWILFHGYSPKLKFANKINKYKTDKGEIRYRIKFANMGKRNIIDVELKALLRIKGLYPNNPSLIELIGLKLAGNKITVLNPKNNNHGKMLRIKVEKTNFFYSNNVSKEINEQAENNSLSLENVMDLGTSSTLQFIALGYDEFSGSRKLFQSRLLTKNDIVFGKYDRKSLEIIEDEEKNKLKLKETHIFTKE